MPKITIDGIELEVAKGTRIIEAAKQAGIDIPFYCYHPGLSVAGNCRMCLVEIEKMPKLQIACHLEAQEGMVIHTKNEKVAQTRKHVLEFLLINHPVDCPVCDQAGECWLQDYYMRHGVYDSRLNENKIKKPKAVSVGPTVMLDAERCILCSRCVRFTDEISKTSEFGIINRGNHSEITVFPGKELNNPYSGNVVDICPVGALTDKDFRFKVRVWYLKSKETLCNGCSRGCNIDLQYRKDERPHHGKGERVMRLKPRFNEHINKWWMCDEGRYGYKVHDHNRISRPVIREHENFKETGWSEILPEVASKIISGRQRVAVLLSPQLSNEELFAADKLFKEQLDLKNIFLVSPQHEGFQDDFLIRADKNPNSKGAELLGCIPQPKALEDFFTACGRGEIEGAVFFGQDLLTLYPGQFTQEAMSRLKWTLFIGPNHNLTSGFSGYVLPSATHFEKEGTFTNFEGRIQKFNQVFEPLGEAKPELVIFHELGKFLGKPAFSEKPQDVFNELSANVEAFKGLSYETLTGEKGNIRKFGAPMIPSFVQSSDLIFMQTAQETKTGAEEQTKV